MKAFVEYEPKARLFVSRQRPHHHGPLDAGPFRGGISESQFLGRGAGEHAVERFQLAFCVRLICDGVARAWVDKEERAAQLHFPERTVVAIGERFRLRKVLAGFWGINRGSLCCDMC